MFRKIAVINPLAHWSGLQIPTSGKEIFSQIEIRHCNFHTHELKVSQNYLPEKKKVNIVLTSGASCPDAIVDAVLKKLLSYFKNVKELEKVVEKALI